MEMFVKVGSSGWRGWRGGELGSFLPGSKDKYQAASDKEVAASPGETDTEGCKALQEILAPTRPALTRKSLLLLQVQ